MDQNDAPAKGPKPHNPAQIAKQKRLVAALRENLKRRKAQGKLRESDASEQRTGQKPQAETE